MYQKVPYQNIQYGELYHEAEVLAGVDHFIQEVCLGMNRTGFVGDFFI